MKDIKLKESYSLKCFIVLGVGVDMISVCIHGLHDYVCWEV